MGGPGNAIVATGRSDHAAAARISRAPARCLAAAFGLLATACVAAVQAGGVPCPDGHASVQLAGDATDVDTFCHAAARTVQFMAAHGFVTDLSLRIRVQASIALPHPGQPVGHFDSRTGTVHILSRAACRRAGAAHQPFDQPMSDALYASFVTHEVAHAIAQHNFAHHAPSVAAQEYVAYVVQIALMPAALRDRVLRATDVEAFGSAAEISSVYYGLNPHAFGVKAYLHYLSPAGGDGFMRRLLDGDVVLSNGDWLE